MPILAMSAGTVTSVWGNAFVRLPNGSLKPIQVGDKVKGGEHIITDDDGIVEISPAKGHPAVLVKAEVAPESVNKAIAGIEGQNPEDVPAAGITGGADGGLQPGLRVDRVAETVGASSYVFATAQATPAIPVNQAVDPRLLATQEPLPKASINDISVNEGAGAATFTITLDKASTQPVTISYATQPGTAVPAGDYVAKTGSVTFQPGETSKTISVDIVNDDRYEGAETFTVKISATANASLGTDVGTAIIHDDGTGSVPAGVTPDDDRPHAVATTGQTQTAEGGSLDFHFKLSHDSTTDTPLTIKLTGLGDHPAVIGTDTGEVTISLGDGPALPATVGADGHISFTVPALTPADTDIVVHIATAADDIYQGHRDLQLSVATPYDDVHTAVTMTGTITDDASKPYMLVLNGEPATEGAPVGFNVVLTHASAMPVTVKLALADGVDDPNTPENESATVGVDTSTQLEYETADGSWVLVPDSGELTFAAGQTQLHVRVATIDDAEPESTEYIKLQATVVSGDTVNQTHANQTAIIDNDTPPEQPPYMLVLNGEPAVEGNPVGFNVVLTHATDSPVTVKFALLDGTDPDASAKVGIDTGTQLQYEDFEGNWHDLSGNGQLTFDPGQTQLHLRVATLFDQVAEDVEYIKLQATVVDGVTANQMHSNQTAIVNYDVATIDDPHVPATLTDPTSSGSEVFAWHFSDVIGAGGVPHQAVDAITHFHSQTPSAGGDVLDLRDLLQGENTAGGTGNLDQYLHFDTSGSNTVIHVAPAGDLDPVQAFNGPSNLQIVLKDVNLKVELGLDPGLNSVATDQQIIAKLLQQGNLLVDHA